CHRGHTVEDIYRSVDLTIKTDLKANVDFIFGLPGETIEDIEKTVELINWLIAMGARIHAHAFMPLPQTFFASMEPGQINKDMAAISGKWPKAVYGNWKEQRGISGKNIGIFKEEYS
ncbi:MAG: B12-binding domain-containing radical SAM protein, partial [Smithella sp.]